MKYKWTFDDTHQTLIAPSGLRLTVHEIATWVQDKVYGRADLTGQWAGWKIRGGVLKGPSGQKLSMNWLKSQKPDEDRIELERRQLTLF